MIGISISLPVIPTSPLSNSIPVPSLKCNLLVPDNSISPSPVKSVPELLVIATSAVPNVASDNTNDPSASQRSVAKLYTSECAPVTPAAAFECTPANTLVSSPNPPDVGSVFPKSDPANISVSSTSKLVVLNVVVVPFTVKSPVTVKLPPTVALEATANTPSPGSVPDVPTLSPAVLV